MHLVLDKSFLKRTQYSFWIRNILGCLMVKKVSTYDEHLTYLQQEVVECNE